jgi:hypothetical protein
VLLLWLVDPEKGRPTLATNVAQPGPAKQFADQKWVIGNGLCSHNDTLNPFSIDRGDFARRLDRPMETAPRWVVDRKILLDCKCDPARQRSMPDFLC